MSSVSSNVYSGLATYGRINSIISLVIMSIICIIAICIGIYLATKDPTKTSKTSGTVADITPQFYNVKYNVNDKEYTLVVNGSNSSNYNGKIVDVHYNPHNPNDARVGSSKRTIGLIIIGIAVIMLVISVITTYFTMKSKTFAAIEGGAAAASQIKNII